MKIGFHVGHVVGAGRDLQQQWQDQLEQLRAARAAGFHFSTWGHHWLIAPFQHFQPFPVLARLAAEAGPMDLGTGVLLTPLLNPVQVAEDVATLDHICQGRFIFGIGLGYRAEEFEAAGITSSERVGRFEEGLALMKRLWTDEEVTHHGRFYHVTGARPTARPFQRPHPRIWLAGMSDPAVRRAGRLGHPFFALGTLDYPALERLLHLWRSGLREHGHAEPAEVPILREFFVARTHEEAWRRARSSVEAKYRGYAEHGLPTARESLAMGVDAMMRDPFIIGSPHECLERLARFRDLGVTHVALRLFWPEMEQREVLDMIELAGATLVPALSRL